MDSFSLIQFELLLIELFKVLLLHLTTGGTLELQKKRNVVTFIYF